MLFYINCSSPENHLRPLFFDRSLLGLPYDIGSTRTNHKFRCFGEVRQSNILIPSKIPFIWKCYFYYYFFQKVRGGGVGTCPPPSPSPCADPVIKKRLKSAIKFEYISCMDAGTSSYVCFLSNRM